MGRCAYGAQVTGEGTQAARPAVASRWASRLDSGSLTERSCRPRPSLSERAGAGVRGWRLAGEAGGAAVMGAILAGLLVSLHVH